MRAANERARTRGVLGLRERLHLLLREIFGHDDEARQTAPLLVSHVFVECV